MSSASSLYKLVLSQILDTLEEGNRPPHQVRRSLYAALLLVTRTLYFLTIDACLKCWCTRRQHSLSRREYSQCPSKKQGLRELGVVGMYNKPSTFGDPIGKLVPIINSTESPRKRQKKKTVKASHDYPQFRAMQEMPKSKDRTRIERVT